MSIVTDVKNTLAELWDRFAKYDEEYSHLEYLLETPDYSASGSMEASDRRFGVNERLITLDWEFERIEKDADQLIDLLVVCQRLVQVVPLPIVSCQPAVLQVAA